jgi:uncharacterized OB-fold protein
VEQDSGGHAPPVSLTAVSDAEKSIAIEPGLFRDDGRGPRLIGARCSSCGQRFFPYGDTCPWCGADGTAEVLLAATGTLWAWTAVTAPPPGYSGAVPYGFGVVQLDDGVRVITRLTESDPAAVRFGQPMALVLETVDHDDAGNDIVTWAFDPVEVT